MANEETINGEEVIPGPVTYLILIGISEYEDPAWNIPTCVNDCTSLRDLLTSKYKNFEIYRELYNDKAGLEDIDQAIADFNANTEINKEPNNLIIFYSGHGEIYNTGGRDIGAWVPYDYKGVKRKQLMHFDELTKLIEGAKTTHVLIISDSCYSGGIFNEGKVFDSTNVAVDRPNIGYEPSRMGLASSRANKISLSKQGATNSVFTEKLLAILESEISDVLSFTTINAKLQKAFRDHDIQRVVFNQIQVYKNNTGVLELNGRTDAVKTKRKTAILESEFISLNYTAQREQFDELQKQGNKKFVFISGSPACGLPLLALQAKQHNFLPAEYLPLAVAPVMVSGEGDAQILNLFRNIPDYKKFSDLKFLEPALLKTLGNTNLILELHFYKGSGQSDFLPEHKKDFLDELAVFVDRLNSTTDKKLIIFVVDQEKCDYKTLYAGGSVNGIPGIYFPPVDPMQYPPTETWFKKMRTSVRARNDEDSPEFDNYFPPSILEHIKTMIDNDENSPAAIVKGMCDKSGCGHLADKLLNPKLK